MDKVKEKVKDTAKEHVETKEKADTHKEKATVKAEAEHGKTDKASKADSQKATKSYSEKELNKLKGKEAGEVFDKSNFDKSVDGKVVTLTYKENELVKNTNKEILKEIEHLKRYYLRKVVDFSSEVVKEELATGKVDKVVMVFPMGSDKNDRVTIQADKVKETYSGFGTDKKHHKSVGFQVDVKTSVSKAPRSLVHDKKAEITEYLKSLGGEWADLYKTTD